MPALRFRLAFVVLVAFAAAACAGGRNGVVPRGEPSRAAQTVGRSATSWTGTITSMITNQFSLHNSTCGYVHVMTSSSTQILPPGAKLAVGENVTVTGSGSCSTSITAATVTVNGAGTPSPTPTPTPASTPSASPTPTTTPSTTPTPSGGVPKHVMTADYMYNSHNRPYSAYTSSLTWAESNDFNLPYNGRALSQAGIKVMAYTNPNRIEQGEPLYSNFEDTFAHDCNGNRIYAVHRPSQYLMDPHSQRLTGFWQQWEMNLASTDYFDALFDDDPDNFYALSAMPCNYAEPDWFNATVAQMQALGIGNRFIYNELAVFGPNYSLPPHMQFNPYSLGGLMEDCYGSVFNPNFIPSPQWQAIVNTQIAMAKAQKLFFCYQSQQGSASTSQVGRIYTYASFMLTLDLNTSIFWEYYSTASGYHVEPETQLVPTQPLVVKVSDASTMRMAGGAYAREYAACYIASKPVGPCAAVVNPDPYAHPYPLGSKYAHTIVLNGGGILDGGTIATNGPPPASTLQPTTGMIVFK